MKRAADDADQEHHRWPRPASPANVVPDSNTYRLVRQPSALPDIVCAICREVFRQPYITQCGHSFCYACLEAHMEHSSLCPICQAEPVTKSTIIPNLHLNSAVQRTAELQHPGMFLQQLMAEPAALSLPDINAMLAVLEQQKRSRQTDTRLLDYELCGDFLNRALTEREKRIQELRTEMEIICSDQALLRTQVQALEATVLQDSSGMRVQPPLAAAASTSPAKHPATLSPSKPADAMEARSSKQQRLSVHFDDLQRYYLDTHQAHDGKPAGSALDAFQSNLSHFMRYSRFRIFSQIKYSTLFRCTGIVSSIEFDCQSEFFATAGVAKKIKIYEFQRIAEQPHVECHQPVKEMSCCSKISCLSWNPYVRQHMASSDYEGIVSLWDSFTGQPVRLYEEHEKRSWSVDFSPSKPSCFASGSDDTTVKIWSTNEPHSVATIDSKANVCCVKFNPDNSNYLAFGSADHHIHYYDLRNLREDLFVFKGHSKAVSYVKFLNANELVSASTDSTLKLWSTQQNECKRTFTGHINEKNFVGLSTHGDFVACGSENNAVYAYHKALSKPALSFKFSMINPGQAGDGLVDDTNNFVSSVCWKQDSNMLLAANSLGVVNVMTLE